MREFDANLWRARSWARFERAIQQGGEQQPLEKQWFEEVQCITDIGLLVDWCASRGLAVLFGKKQNGTYDSVGKRIVIACHARPKRQLAYLLHECGHHLIGMKEHHQRFGMGYPQTDPEVRRTFLHRVSCLEEELEAWHRGWKLSRRLNLSLDRATFDTIRLECIKSYIKWTLQRNTRVEEVNDDE